MNCSWKKFILSDDGGLSNYELTIKILCPNNMHLILQSADNGKDCQMPYSHLSADNGKDCHMPYSHLSADNGKDCQMPYSYLSAEYPYNLLLSIDFLHFSTSKIIQYCEL